jgi:hypothetical protein
MYLIAHVRDQENLTDSRRNDMENKKILDSGTQVYSNFLMVYRSRQTF